MKTKYLVILAVVAAVAVCAIEVLSRSVRPESKFRLYNAVSRLSEVDGFMWHYGLIDGEAVIVKAVPLNLLVRFEKVALPTIIEGYPVHMVVGDVFGANISVGTLVISDGITDIGSFAFWNNKIERVELSSTVTNIDSNAFRSYTYKEYVVDPDNPMYCSNNGLLCSKDGRVLIRGTDGAMKIPDSIEQISNGAFCYRKVLNVPFPRNIKNIGSGAFLGCEGLEHVVVPSGVKSIAEFTFEMCRDLEYVEIPSTVTNIGAYAFEGCDRLKKVVIHEGAIKIEKYAFANCKSLESLIIPSSVESIGEFAFSACGSGLKMDINTEGIHVDPTAFSVTNNLVRQ